MAKAVIKPFQNLFMSPFNSTLHYGVQCYQGLKAYKNQKGEIRLFRAQCNMKRFKTSSVRASLPDFDGAEILKVLKQYTLLQSDYIPPMKGPFHISLEDSLCVKAPSKSAILIVSSPVGPYYPTGFNPISLFCDTYHVRSAPGGTGGFKLGGNYGPTIQVSNEAAKKGHQQVLKIRPIWMDHSPQKMIRHLINLYYKCCPLRTLNFIQQNILSFYKNYQYYSMDALLKNFGLSDTRFQLKFQTPSRKMKKTYEQTKFNKQPKTQSKKQKQTHKCSPSFKQKFNESHIRKQTNFDQQKKSKHFNFRQRKNEKAPEIWANSQNQKQIKNEKYALINSVFKQALLIDQIILLLQKNCKQKCFLKGHEYNLKRFVCLQQNCKDKIGCSYCFLHEHRSHAKCQIKTCTKDLQELKAKIISNNDMMKHKAQSFKNEFLKQIQQQINFIRSEFDANMSFLHKKISDIVQSFVNDKYGKFLIDYYQSQKLSEFQEQHLNETIKFSSLKQKVQKQVSSENSQEKRQKILLHQLSILNFQQVQIYLQNRLGQIENQKKQSTIFVDYFQQMSSSISMFFSAFKKNIPKVYLQNYVKKGPLILNFV